MKSILTVSVFIVLFTSFAQKDTLKAEVNEIPTQPPKVLKMDSVAKEIKVINERYESILDKDELIDKKIAEIIKEKSEINSKLKTENKKLTAKIETKEKDSELKTKKIDSLESVIKQIESSTVVVDSILVCVRWGFLARHTDENCKEWKLIIKQ